MNKYFDRVKGVKSNGVELDAEMVEYVSELIGMVGEDKELLLKPENLQRIVDVVMAQPESLEEHEAVIEAITKEQGDPKQTKSFNEDGFGADGKTPKGKGKGKGKGRSSMTGVSKVIADNAENLLATNYGACASFISSHGAVCGYLTPTPEHFDIAKLSKSLKDGGLATTFVTKFVAPGPVRGFCTALPSKAAEEVRKIASLDISPDECDVEAGTDLNQSYFLENMNPERFTNSFINSEAAGSIREADEIFTPCVTRRYSAGTKSYTIKAYDSLADVDAKVKADENILGGKNAIVATVSYKKTDGGAKVPVVRVKHTLRPRFQAPGNYVPARVYETITMKDQYTAEEAKNLNKIYFDRFKTAKYKSVPVLDTLQAGQTEVVVGFDSSNTKEIQSTRFFTTDANASAFKGKVEHWVEREANGELKQVNLIGKELIKRYAVANKSDPTKSTIKIAYKDLQTAQNAEGTAYTLDTLKGCNVLKALDAFKVPYTASDFIKFFKDNSILRDKKNPSGNTSSAPKVGKPVGIRTFGFSITNKSKALQAALSSAASNI